MTIPPIDDGAPRNPDPRAPLVPGVAPQAPLVVPSVAAAPPAPPAPPVPPAPADETPRHHAGHRTLGMLRETSIIVISALVLSVLVRTFLIQAFYVPSESMEDTLLPSDRILASKVTTRFAGVQRGDVVVFSDPGGWLPPAPPVTGFAGALRNVLMFTGLLPSDTGQDLVKRVIAVGGDRIRCCDRQGRIVLNGVSLDESSYVKPGDTTDQVRFDVTVPQGMVFVMGDNRSNSRDSRYHLEESNGGVPVDDVVGKVVLVVWPISRFTTVGTPPVFDNPALNAVP